MTEALVSKEDILIEKKKHITGNKYYPKSKPNDKLLREAPPKIREYIKIKWKNIVYWL